ncbi:hypothetical protein JYU14_01175 [Simkania negevensis]|uniref:OmpA-like domain-containing protein n=1 Tax=Simkania negevensis TaxID=83561 RepID=A0ABS3APQ6_9BACT|nr:hypothetical protein [Simkania negevensis]
MRKKKCKCPKPGLSAPFFMLTYGDLMTLLLVFFVLLFAMSTIEVVKFQAQIGAIKGALGISQFYQYAPMIKNLPTPSMRTSPRVVALSKVKPTTLKPLSEYKRIDLTEPVQKEENEKVRMIQAIGIEGDLTMQIEKDEVILVLPSFGIFSKDSYTINPDSPEVHRAKKLYAKLGQQMAKLVDYDIYFVGHTDALPMKPVSQGPQNKMELGFMRSVAMYEFFFAEYLKDKTRIVFASQGDNIPIVPDASLDSERRKNRRVEVLLKKKTGSIEE